MTSDSLISFVAEAIVGGVTGNAAYDAVKKTFQNWFQQRWQSTDKEHVLAFKAELRSVLENNSQLLQQLQQIYDSNASRVINNHTGSGDNIGRDKIVYVSVNGKNELAVQAHRACLALKQMPRLLQEAIDGGAMEYSFTDAAKELKELYVLSCASTDKRILGLFDEIQRRNNGYIDCIRQAAKREINIDEVNRYHSVELVGWFENNVLTVFED